MLASTTTYLEACRPISVSMSNALKHLKWLLSELPNAITDHEVVLREDDQGMMERNIIVFDIFRLKLNYETLSTITLRNRST